MTTEYSKLKVAELKELIKDRGIPQTGLKVKQHFIEALEAQDAESRGENSVEIEGAGAVATVNQAVEAVDTGATETATPTAVDVEEKDVPQNIEANGGNEPSSDDADVSNKRKRSSTPRLREESMSKKLKSAADMVDDKLPEDGVARVPAPVDTENVSTEKIIPHDSSDHVLDVKDVPMSDAEETAGQTEPTQDMVEGKAADAMRPEEKNTAIHETDVVGLVSRHPRTRALYIRELLRPLQPNALREHLETISQSAIEDFHLDKIRTHAFVLFESVDAATRVRAALHDNKWPDEAMRKPLWIDYIPEDKVREWVDIEVSKGDTTRWEVVYESTGLDTDSGVTASLQEADARPNAGRQTSTNSAAPRAVPGAGEGMPNAPSGPRQRSDQAQAPTARPAPPPQRAPENRTFDSLDQRYSFTETKPKLYYQPVAGDLAQRRLDDLATATSREWNDRDADPSAYAEGELYRYTF
ncbi:hypothetical protein DOTSEDRAFT_71263, partial [Dothistroma septosporum NZE10]